MIYTITFSPSLDYIMHLSHLEVGGISRAQKESISLGGKGINVSVVLSQLGIENQALGFIAGFTGNALKEMLQEKKQNMDFIELKEGNTRINVKIKADIESEVNGQGPSISEEALQQLFEKVKSFLPGDILVLAGTIPSSLPETIYEDLIRELPEGVSFVVDATKELLKKVLPYHPFLVKPNEHELGELYGVTLKTKEDVIPYAKKLQSKGAKNVLVSMAGEGAVLITETGEVYQTLPPKGKVVNSVGAGDSMVAGFLAGYLQTHDYEKALELGIASGSASAFHEFLATRDQIVSLLSHPESFNF